MKTIHLILKRFLMGINIRLLLNNIFNIKIVHDVEINHCPKCKSNIPPFTKFLFLGNIESTYYSICMSCWNKIKDMQ